MAATFIRFLHKNIGWFQFNVIHFHFELRLGDIIYSHFILFVTGGSETFQDKVNFFQRELRHIHSKRPRTKTCLKITRYAILDSVSAAFMHKKACFISCVSQK